MLPRCGEKGGVSRIRLALKTLANTALAHCEEALARTALADSLKALVVRVGDEKMLLSDLAATDSVVLFYFNLLTS